MRNKNFLLVLVISAFVSWGGSEVLGQSGSRGSGSRGRAAPGGSYGLPSRVGGARSKAIPTRGRPTGMMNSANAARFSGGRRSAGSGSRATTGLTPRNPISPGLRSGSPSAFGSGTPAPRPTTGLSRPSRARSSAANSSIRSSSPLDRITTATSTLPKGLRTWTDASGRYTIQGKLAAKRDDVVWIRRLDGKLARLKLDQLSKADQQFLVNR